MLANMCVEAHLRELLKRGFEVAVLKDAVAGPRHPVWGDGYQAAMINTGSWRTPCRRPPRPSIERAESSMSRAPPATTVEMARRRRLSACGRNEAMFLDDRDAIADRHDHDRSAAGRVQSDRRRQRSVR